MKSFLSVFLLLACAGPAFAEVTVTNPKSSATVVSPFEVDAVASACSTQPIAAMGYSIDDSPNTTIVRGTVMSAQATAALGAHTLHVKSWGDGGLPCVTDVPINVVLSSAPFIPITATAVTDIQALAGWNAVMDAATGAGQSHGTTALTSAPSLSGAGRQFLTDTTDVAGERYYVSFGTDRAATDFVYDAWVYLASPSANVGKLEFEMNQVIPNGQTVIFGVRCNGATGLWEYTQNGGSPQAFSDEWAPSAAACDPASWGEDAWHHVQVLYARDDVGSVTYESVWLDGAKQDLNVTTPSAFALGWDSSVLVTNFQVDGAGQSASSTVYLDHLTVYRWTRAITSALSLVPMDAKAVIDIQALPGWKAVNDVGTGSGGSAGAMSVVSAPSLAGSGRQFMTDYSNGGGERYSVAFDGDTVATNFMYDGWVYLASPTSGIGNVEMDMNQVLADGRTVIFGIQCNGGTGTWDYTENAGTPVLFDDEWVHSKAACNPRNWTPDAWHHVQLTYERDDAGNVTYKSVWLDDVEQDLNVTVPSSFALGWAPVLVTNFQIDGSGPLGSAVAYLDNLTVYRW
jgi:hypothetical protein